MITWLAIHQAATSSAFAPIFVARAVTASSASG